MRHGLAAFPGDDADRLLSGGGISVDAEDKRALAGKGDRGRLAVTPARADRPGADHHRNLALEPIHRHSPVYFVYHSHARSVVSSATNSDGRDVTHEVTQASPVQAYASAASARNFMNRILPM